MLIASIRKRGFIRTVQMAWSDLSFDWRFHTDTRRVVGVELLAPADSLAAKDASIYQPASAWIVQLLFAELSKEPSKVSIVDYGSGKGRVLIMAAEYGFRSVTGIEFSPLLVSIAERNLDRYRRRVPLAPIIKVLTADASAVELDDDVGVAFFYNPFGPTVMSGVLDAIIRSLRRKPRRFRIGYVNPRMDDLFTAMGFQEVSRLVSKGTFIEAIVYGYGPTE
jgi:SAM-dependent methyltransferase